MPLGQNHLISSGMVLEVHMHLQKYKSGAPHMRSGLGALGGWLHEHSYVAEYVIVLYCHKQIESSAMYKRYGYRSKYTCSSFFFIGGRSTLAFIGTSLRGLGDADDLQLLGVGSMCKRSRILNLSVLTFRY